MHGNERADTMACNAIDGNFEYDENDSDNYESDNNDGDNYGGDSECECSYCSCDDAATCRDDCYCSDCEDECDKMC